MPGFLCMEAFIPDDQGWSEKVLMHGSIYT